MRFELGEVLKDKVTGFKGVAMARTEYYTGCTHYGLAAQNLKDRKPIDWEWFDDVRLERVAGAKRILLNSGIPTSGEFPGAPQM